ncbi:hypothetical protein [Halobacillus naozhouensis]|uniref:MerR HTH family regulatory protein n=1 Tax=Halobacillus naozhouensis TaxID=554880 RepID=A0ABY8J6Q5_9BACI|nr:hypothetical protein [Halobacillus naozhouensis]WFT77093.1 hypothetical protein P9989_21540 [Halobacillus naozhouensis]
MDELQTEYERMYSPGEVALHIEIERQTVTKYARLFENNGYNFHKDEKGNRLYSDTNVLMFKDLINKRNKPGMTLEAAAKSLTDIYKSKSVTDTVSNDSDEKANYAAIMEKLESLEEKFNEQKEFNKNLVLELQASEKRTKTLINNKVESMQQSLSEHDRIRQEQLEKDLERYRLAAPEIEEEAAEEVAATTEQPPKKEKKGWMDKLWPFS